MSSELPRLYERPWAASRHGLREFFIEHEKAVQRASEILPGALTWFLITAPIWASTFAAPLVAVLAVLFEAYWLYLGCRLTIFGVLGWRRMRATALVDWRAAYEQARRQGRAFLLWHAVHHLVIVPNYSERVDKLRQTLTGLANQVNAKTQLSVVLAMEGREPSAETKAQQLLREFEGRFAHLFYTVHPAELPGEVAGKSSNEAWAARWAKARLVDELGYDLRHLTVNSCDADSILHPRYFESLTYHFATDPDRYRRFWQAPMLFYRNTWQVPSLVRVASGLNGLVYLAYLADPRRTLFPLSTYSLSLQLADTVGYWDTDVIPEDWHMFLKCYFHQRGLVKLIPIYLPIQSEAPRASSYFGTLLNAYHQIQRHAWGASDIAYTLRQCVLHPEISVSRRLKRLWAVAEHHLLWSTTWFLLTLGINAPAMLNPAFARSVLHQDLGQIASLLFNVAAVMLLTLAILETRLRPPRPASAPWWRTGTIYLQWLLLPVAGLVLGTLPAIHAQTRLMLGHNLAYRVTEKV